MTKNKSSYMIRKTVETKERGIVMKEEKATFVVDVLYRNAATWQGRIRWVEGDRTRNFRSEMELVHLMDSVLGVDAADQTDDNKT